jgi:hypothetical protein
MDDIIPFSIIVKDELKLGQKLTQNGLAQGSLYLSEPSLIPPIKHRDLPKPIAGTIQTIVEKSDPDYYGRMPIPSTAKPTSC